LEIAVCRGRDSNSKFKSLILARIHLMTLIEESKNTNDTKVGRAILTRNPFVWDGERFDL
jgi:hypothetical protein